MSIHIFNTLSKRKEEFVPLDGKIVKMYSCGVTVYDACHLGHARSLYIFDVIRRYLKYRGYDVRFVRNITDVDDKIINRAKEMKKSHLVVAQENIDLYQADLKSLGVAQADLEPRATENIDGMITLIEGLIVKDFAYVANGDVYFNVRKFADYGKLSGQSIDKMLESVRIDNETNKRDPLDFALWKKSGEGEFFWDSPWGNGRPGWHIECSCMSMKHLDCETLDIHAGGRDLVFPHHENEIAQSEAFTGKPFAKYWIHHGLLSIDGQKMSKSLGNFITIQDVLKKYPVDDLKMFFLFSHYASPIDYTQEKILEAHKALQRFDILFWKTSEILKNKDVEAVSAGFIEQHYQQFIDAMDDDFNTPKALASLFNLVNDTNKFVDENKADVNYLGIIFKAVDTLEQLARHIFGLFGKEPVLELTIEHAQLIEERKEARLSKNFKRSDELRDLLKKHKIVVEDTKEGQTWRWA